jgi:hypothetical protein
MTAGHISADVKGSGRVMLRLMAAALGLTSLILLGLGAYTIRSFQASHRVLTEQVRLKELIGSIVHLDEVLTMSARMASATGDAGWEQRYRFFETQLDADIRAAQEMAQDLPSQQSTAQTAAANVQLVAMENQAFELVRQGRRDEAQRVLLSPAYETNKAVYIQGIQRLTTTLQQQAQEAVRRQQQHGAWLAGAVLVALVLLLASWLYVFRAVSAWQLAMLADRRQLAEQAEALATLNRTLDGRVAERTAELLKAVTNLEGEVAKRRITEEALEAKVRQMENLNRVMVDREMRMVEMKQEVDVLLQELGRPVKYEARTFPPDAQ